ncbi:MAG: hypothetical protein WCW14_05195, partial [Candidatus Paceibacterota bacterium]
MKESIIGNVKVPAGKYVGTFVNRLTGDVIAREYTSEEYRKKIKDTIKKRKARAAEKLVTRAKQMATIAENIKKAEE